MNARIIINVEVSPTSGPETLKALLDIARQALETQTIVTRTTGTIQQCGKAGERLGRLVVSA